MEENKVRTIGIRASTPMHGWMFILMLLMILILISGCGQDHKNAINKATNGSGNLAADGKIKVVTTIAQIADPISVIGGDRLEVQSLMGPGIDPHLYQATQGDIHRLESSELIFYNGLNLEANMVDIFNEIGKNRPVLAIGEVIAEEQLLYDEEGNIDPHIWFDIDLWQQAIAAATEQLKQYSAKDAAFFEDNMNQYFAELQAFKVEAAEKMQDIPQEQRVLVTAHDAFGYLGRMLGIDVVGLQGLSTEDEIGLSDIDDTIALLVASNVPAVFVESSINPDSIQAVVEGAKRRGHEVVVGGELFSDAMGDKGTVEGTYLGMYRHNVKVIYEALSGNAEGGTEVSAEVSVKVRGE